MRQKIKHALIPHEGNGYKPTLFHYASISAVLVLGIIFFLSSVAATGYLTKTEQGAAVYTSVLVDLTNKARVQNDASELTVSDTLTRAAQMKADDMAARQYFSHTSPDGTTPWYWFQKAGYEFMYAGENLAVDFTESSDVETAWLASPKHRENIVDPRFTEIGIATKTGIWQGRQTTFVVQLFGAPTRIASVAIAEASAQQGSASGATSSGSDDSLNPEVAGASESAPLQSASEQPIKVISETDDTIVAQNESAFSVVSLAAQSEASKSTLADRALVRIPSISNYALTALAVIVLLGLLLFVFVEIRRQHPKHVFAGVVAFFILASLAYTSHAFALPI
ncbi:MAG TPA: CAP domain-containing protein [Candidatus Paceibacterota bacterium]|nr:CAP domain-containing protein [Candidatus Paceibacterota bacterium]